MNLTPKANLAITKVKGWEMKVDWKTRWSGVRFRWRMTTWPIYVAVKRFICWLPFWWLRRHFPAEYAAHWTPVYAVKCLARDWADEKQRAERYLREWGKCEEALRKERLGRVSDMASDTQKDWALRTLGVDIDDRSKN